MNTQQRRNTILQLIAEHGAVTVAELCERFGVSDVTVRRDLSALERAGLLRRIHGGAVSSRGRSYEPPFLTRAQESRAAKEAIGAFAATMVQEGDSVALDVGTTTLAMARHLTHLHGITVVTASLPIANVLADHPQIRVILSGGILRAGEQSLIGTIATETFARFHVDKAFIGIGGVDLENGLTEYNVEDADVKRQLIRSSRYRIVLADSTKFGRTTFTAVASLSAVHEIVTDDALDDATCAALEEHGIRVHRVPTA